MAVIKARDGSGRWLKVEPETKLKMEIRQWIQEDTQPNVILGRIMSQADKSYGWAYKIYNEILEENETKRV